MPIRLCHPAAFALFVASTVFALGGVCAGATPPPNIVVIVTDDQGYADISFNPHHPEDALARDGVFFTQAYLSGNVCSPTRAGLMLGRYQQRVGVYTAGDGGRGFDPTIPIFPALLPEPYVSMAVGKWHLGLDEDYPELKWHALNRGFDECYKFMGRGAHDYFDLKIPDHPIYRGLNRIEDEGYLTTRLTEEAVAFIDRRKDQPFFLYLAYNAVHSPKQAPPEDIARYRKQFPGLTAGRAILMAMLHHLDLGVGAVAGKLKDEGIWDNTLLFFFTDNGGAKAMEANNAPLRGFKGSCSEGGIRTPLVVSWPDKIQGGRTIATPVISLDVLPTVLDAIGAPGPTDGPLDGKSLLPLLRGETTTLHPHLFWSEGGLGGEWAVRSGNWKLIAIRDQVELYDLQADESEITNLATKHADKVAELTGLYDAWIDQVAEPLSGKGKRWAPPEQTPPTHREKERLRKRRERKKRHEAEDRAQSQTTDRP